MSDSRKKSQSDDPHPPRIPYRLDTFDKGNFAGTLASSILYGVLIAVFFKCMAAFFNPIHRRGEPIKWGVVFYTVVMFSLVTAGTLTNLDILSISYIDHRGFPGVEGSIHPGPFGYQVFISSEAINMIPSAVLTLSNWLADGLLLYRCSTLYSMNPWVIAFPCLVYLGSLAMGIAFLYQTTVLTKAIQWSALPWFSISLSLNVLLTLMIIIRLILHTRSVRTAVGITGIGGLCKTIVTMLVESCALFAVNSLLVIAPWGTKNPTTNIFFPILAQTQVLAPLLVIQRVANKSAFVNNTVASGRVNEWAGSRGRSTGSTGMVLGGDPASSVDGHGAGFGELGAGVETTVGVRWDKV